MVDVVSPDFELPSEDEDEVLGGSVLCGGSKLGGGEEHSESPAEALVDDTTLWADEVEKEVGEKKEDEDEDDEDEEDEDEHRDSQNFIRLLFSGGGRSAYGGHYDLIASASQRDMIVGMFPDKAAEFVSM